MLNRAFVVASLLLALAVTLAAPVHAQNYNNNEANEVLTPEPYLEKSAFKLVRGVTNIVTSPGEIPKQIVMTTKKRGAVGVVLGLFKGVGMTTVRILSGVYEAATFPLPNDLDGHFGPVVRPEFVWSPSTPTGD